MIDNKTYIVNVFLDLNNLFSVAIVCHWFYFEEI